MLELVLKALRDCRKRVSADSRASQWQIAYSLDNLPGLKSFQSTFPPPSFHSSPSAASNSSSVRPGASLLITTFNLGAEALPCTVLVGRIVGAPFCVADAGIERMPFAEAIFGILALSCWVADDVGWRA